MNTVVAHNLMFKMGVALESKLVLVFTLCILLLLLYYNIIVAVSSSFFK